MGSGHWAVEELSVAMRVDGRLLDDYVRIRVQVLSDNAQVSRSSLHVWRKSLS